MARRFELAAEIEAADLAHKARIAPMKEEQTLCERFIKESMLAANEQQVKTDAGMTFFTTKTSAKVTDMDAVLRTCLSAVPEPSWLGHGCSWQQVLDHVAAHGNWGLLTRAVSKDAVKEMIEAGEQVHGVEISSYKDLSWRKAS